MWLFLFPFSPIVIFTRYFSSFSFNDFTISMAMPFFIFFAYLPQTFHPLFPSPVSPIFHFPHFITISFSIFSSISFAVISSFPSLCSWYYLLFLFLFMVVVIFLFTYLSPYFSIISCTIYVFMFSLFPLPSFSSPFTPIPLPSLFMPRISFAISLSTFCTILHIVYHVHDHFFRQFFLFAVFFFTVFMIIFFFFYHLTIYVLYNLSFVIPSPSSRFYLLPHYPI